MEIKEAVGSRVERGFYSNLKHKLEEPWSGLREGGRKEASRLLGILDEEASDNVNQTAFSTIFGCLTFFFPKQFLCGSILEKGWPRYALAASPSLYAIARLVSALIPQEGGGTCFLSGKG